MSTSQEHSSSAVRVEALTKPYIDEALSIHNKFVGSGRKRLCCLIPLVLFPNTSLEFAALYNSEDAYSASAVAIRESDNKVVGFVRMTDRRIRRDPFDRFLHAVREGECYIEMMSVLPEMRGRGIGNRLLEFCEECARARGADRLTLGVVSRNPAKRLYERFGFVDQKASAASSACACFSIFLILGFPHWGCGGTVMVKTLQ